MMIFAQIWSYFMRPENIEKLNIPKTGMLRRRGVLNIPASFPSMNRAIDRKFINSLLDGLRLRLRQDGGFRLGNKRGC